ncbi:unnamed protein product [Phaedon cochleariae]|uniref:NADP-dependent oxidoreductase domain-containing protein n=1 Tax=Phaedon cochleariae TaxID=80249 RepID=A0A9N9X3V4_PHACE|nr:unnamed protein product [Phaedon cochleariae]
MYAIDVGYRHIDTAWFYKNEEEIGDALKDTFSKGKIKREDLFIVTKLWNNFHERKSVVPKLKESLKFLRLDYVDLFLIHWPFGFKENSGDLPQDESSFSEVDYLETWKGMEECVDLGLARSIGLSNFNEEQTERVLQNCRIRPVVNQVEVNPNINQKKLIQFCKERDIIVTGFCPLGRLGTVNSAYPQSTVLDPKVVEMASKYNKSPAQIILRYLISLGISVIPKSVTKSRILENFQIFDFALDAEDTAYLDTCNKNQRVSPMATYKDHKYYPF